MKKVTLLIICAVGLFFSFALVADADAAKRKTARRGSVYCQGDHLHYGSSNSFKTKKLAMMDAVESWRGFTVFEYGSEWGFWGRSINKSVKCGRESALWRCSIQSTPCRKALRGEKGKYK